MRFDLHIHTSRYSPDSDTSPEQLLRAAKKHGLDGIVITEHDRLWPERELEELRRQAPDLKIFAGVEITAYLGDVLCYGVKKIDRLPKAIRWNRLVEEVEEQGGVCIAAHPYRWSQDFDELMEEYPGLHGLEMMSNNMDDYLRQKALRYAEQFPALTRLGNSDSHHESTVGCCHTLFLLEIHTEADLLDALRKSQTQPTPGFPKDMRS